MRGALAAAATTAVLLSVQTAAATPEGDAHDAITAAWRAAGGDTSPLGAAQGDVYAVGTGFVQNFAGGKVFFTAGTGAHAMYGAILDTYERMGGAADSGLGFPNGDEVPGLVSPDSRMVTFAGGDNPLIFFTPEHGAHVVRGPINAGWDKLHSSTGPLGVPVDDENYAGPTVTQKFANGALTFDNANKTFNTVPPELSGELADVGAQPDPAAAIDWVWRATGGPAGMLGSKQGEPNPLDGGATVQDFAGGKVFFNPATGPGGLGGDLLDKYDSLGGPAGSDLGFPVGAPVEGPIPGSLVATFSGTDQPVIFFSPDNGAFVVRDAVKSAWDKLGGASGKLGAPVGDESVDGDVVTQKFTGGSVSWNRVANTYSTDPAELARSLAQGQAPGSGAPTAAATAGDQGSSFHWSWVLIPAAVLAVLGALAGTALWWQRRSPAPESVSLRSSRSSGRPAASASENYSGDSRGYDRGAGGGDGGDAWPAGRHEADSTVRLSNRYDDAAGMTTTVLESTAAGESAHRFDDRWSGSAEADYAHHDYADHGYGEPDYADHGYGEHDYAERDYAGLDDADNTDTAPTRIVGESEPDSGADPTGGRHATPAPEHTEVFETFQAFEPVHEDAASHPVMHLPLDDPYLPPDGYPIKASIGSGLYYTPTEAEYADTAADIWFATEDAARLNGFSRVG